MAENVRGISRANNRGISPTGTQNFGGALSQQGDWSLSEQLLMKNSGLLIKIPVKYCGNTSSLSGVMLLPQHTSQIMFNTL